MRVKTFRNNKGITLIALVVTIIVLLILAGVAISILTGENGILRQAANSKEMTEKASVIEQIQLAATAAKINSNYSIETDELKEELKTYFGENGYKLIGNETRGWLVTVGKVEYRIDASGNVKENPNYIDVIAKIKKEYDVKKSELTSTSTLLGYSPYNGTGLNETKLQPGDEQLAEILPSYNPSVVRMILLKGTLLCIYDPDIMTEEKIIECENNDIYLVGDVNGNHKLDFDDYEYIKKIYQRTITPDTRQQLAADINCDQSVNSSDASILRNSFYLQNELKDIKDMKSQFKASLKTKKEQGILATNINASTEEEIKEYIPSYTGNEGIYKFKIQRGVLYWVYDKNITISAEYILNSTIQLLGDYDENGKISKYDIQYFNEDTEGQDTIDIDDEYYRVMNVNGDDKIDETDFDIIRSYYE